jgi:tetrapyrrole methylase family protein/MazG family protein
MIQPDQAFKKLYDIVVRLRGPGGCPWDIEQNPSSLRECLIEETYECIEAINEKNPAHIREELGDLFLLVTMLAYFHEEEGIFSLTDVLQTICEKLTRRHPHVFSETKVKDSNEALGNWKKIKIEQEGRKPKDSILDEISAGIPPLDRACKLQKKAAKVGFDWPSIEGVYDKLQEEISEVMEAVNTKSVEKTEDELGDLLFSAVNLCRYLEIEPSVELHRTNSNFVNRFKYMEKKMKETGMEMNRENLGIMEQYWNAVKK